MVTNGNQAQAQNGKAPNGSGPPVRDPEEELTGEQAEAVLRQLADGLSPGIPDLGQLIGALGGGENAAGGARVIPGRGPAGGSSAGVELAKAEARYRALVEQIPAVTFLASLDEGLNELYVSPQIQTLLGFSQKEWLEDPVLWYRQLHPEDRERWHQDFARTCASAAPFRSEYRFLARDGRVVWVRGECQVVRDASGRALYLQGIAYDITESKRAEEALRRMQEELADLVQERTAELARANESLRAEIAERRRLEEALRQRADQLAEEGRRKDHFLAILAHELRNPLAPIRNALQIMRQPGARGPAIEWARDLMDRQVRHMTRLIDDLLDVSRINQGKIELRKELVDLAAVVTRAAEVTRPLLTERRHELTIALPPEGVRLHADPVRLEQVLVNLLNNAAKYTEPGGHIRVGVEREGDEAVVRVRDDGIGIPPEMLERIFELFTQVDRSVGSTSQWGLGVGLSLVKSLVEMHGGSVRAASAGRGRGSEFIVRLPLAVEGASRNPFPVPGGARGNAAGPPRARDILLVDDSADLAGSLALLLRAWGHEVRVVHDGAAALAEARARPPEVVLLDIGLPGMTGYQLAQHLRQVAGLKDALLVAMTGYGQKEDRRRSREAGCDLHLIKPVDPELLRQLLEDPAAHQEGRL